jgi:hypothetical protein
MRSNRFSNCSFLFFLFLFLLNNIGGASQGTKGLQEAVIKQSLGQITLPVEAEYYLRDINSNVKYGYNGKAYFNRIKYYGIYADKKLILPDICFKPWQSDKLFKQFDSDTVKPGLAGFSIVINNNRINVPADSFKQKVYKNYLVAEIDLKNHVPDSSMLVRGIDTLGKIVRFFLIGWSLDSDSTKNVVREYDLSMFKRTDSIYELNPTGSQIPWPDYGYIISPKNLGKWPWSFNLLGVISPDSGKIFPLKMQQTPAINKKSVIKIDTIYPDKGNLIRFISNGMFGYITKEKEIIINPVYSRAWPFRRGRAKVADIFNNEFFIDEKGNCVKDCPKQILK